ncbi:glycoside hydrolase family 43 protein [Microbacterium sp. Leaf159]|uniref:glycoside hydrolase family 43 protein n=1 Tax=Microbacterium sp. Leaf159 TaxID=1736279 RepID=UPI0006FCDE55|nr:glycoside hydrolase family 43 protein [Microbacterium sp. Leaf159]KQR39353.1 beta-xylosidase [Microbacterium sp. Leaf159]
MSDLALRARTDAGPATTSAAVTPVISGFHPDPTVCRVGDDYYLAHSSFEYFPGAPIFHSRDLVTWTQIGNILTTRDQFRLHTPGPSTGIYGSTLRHHDGRFWFITTNISDFDAGQVIVHSDDPSGPWSEPVFVPEARGIDPDLSWDENGDCYLTWHLLDFVVGGQGIRQARIDLESGALRESPYAVWQGTGMQAAEGPHLHRVGDYWYLILAEGGTERGHCVTVARAEHPTGPFEACPSNPILTHRSTSHPVQSAGHADLVQAPDGEWAIVYLGTRPRGSTPGFHVLGRETFLAGVTWVEGWPVIDEKRFEVPEAVTTFFEDFSGPGFDPRWVVADGEPETAVVREPRGGIRFRSHGSASDLLCTRVLDLDWAAEAVIEDAAELRLRIDEHHWCGVRAHKGRVRAILRVGGAEQLIADEPFDGSTVTLRIEASPPRRPTLPFGSAGPDDITMSVDSASGRTDLARVDGRYFSTEVAAGFTGRMLALGSPDAAGRVLSFHYRSPAQRED